MYILSIFPNTDYTNDYDKALRLYTQGHNRQEIMTCISMLWINAKHPI